MHWRSQVQNVYSPNLLEWELVEESSIILVSYETPSSLALQKVLDRESTLWVG